MSKKDIIEDIYTIADAQGKTRICEEYKKQINNGQKVHIEALNFANDIIIKISIENPEIAAKNFIHPIQYRQITSNLVMDTLVLATNTLKDLINKKNTEAIKDTIEEAKKENNKK